MYKDVISVIIPIYNVENYLKKCIDSVLNQTYKNIEVILIDDGSIDNSPKICEDYKKLDKRVTVIHKSNGGLSDARNYGINFSTGKYICFIDSDDYIDINMIKYLYEALITSESDISICNYYEVYEDNRCILGKAIKYKNKIYTNIEAIEDLFLCDSSNLGPTAWNKLYRRELFTDNEIYFPYRRIHEDAFTTYKLFYYCKKIISINTPLYFYLQRKNSIIGQGFSSKKLDILVCLDETKTFIKEKNLHLQLELKYYYYDFFIRLGLINTIICSKSWEDKYNTILIKEMFKSYSKIRNKKMITMKTKIMYFFIVHNFNLYKYILQKIRNGD